MITNRISNLTDQQPVSFLPSMQPTAFVCCPILVPMAPWAEQIYRAAYENARAAMANTWRGRLNLEFWN